MSWRKFHFNMKQAQIQGNATQVEPFLVKYIMDLQGGEDQESSEQLGPTQAHLHSGKRRPHTVRPPGTQGSALMRTGERDKPARPIASLNAVHYSPQRGQLHPGN
jgi:hypothetical protein